MSDLWGVRWPLGHVTECSESAARTMVEACDGKHEAQLVTRQAGETQWTPVVEEVAPVASFVRIGIDRGDGYKEHCCLTYPDGEEITDTMVASALRLAAALLEAGSEGPILPADVLVDSIDAVIAETETRAGVTSNVA